MIPSSYPTPGTQTPPATGGLPAVEQERQAAAAAAAAEQEREAAEAAERERLAQEAADQQEDADYEPGELVRFADVDPITNEPRQGHALVLNTDDDGAQLLLLPASVIRVPLDALNPDDDS